MTWGLKIVALLVVALLLLISNTAAAAETPTLKRGALFSMSAAACAISIVRSERPGQAAAVGVPVFAVASLVAHKLRHKSVAAAFVQLSGGAFCFAFGSTRDRDVAGRAAPILSETPAVTPSSTPADSPGTAPPENPPTSPDNPPTGDTDSNPGVNPTAPPSAPPPTGCHDNGNGNGCNGTGEAGHSAGTPGSSEDGHQNEPHGNRNQ